MMHDFHARVAKQIMNVALATPELWAHQVTSCFLYFSARLDTAQGTDRFGWLHYFRSPSLPYDGRPETSRRIQAEPNIPANLPASLVLTRSSDCRRSAKR